MNILNRALTESCTDSHMLLYRYLMSVLSLGDSRPRPLIPETPESTEGDIYLESPKGRLRATRPVMSGVPHRTDAYEITVTYTNTVSHSPAQTTSTIRETLIHTQTSTQIIQTTRTLVITSVSTSVTVSTSITLSTDVITSIVGANAESISQSQYDTNIHHNSEIFSPDDPKTTRTGVSEVIKDEEITDTFVKRSVKEDLEYYENFEKDKEEVLGFDMFVVVSQYPPEMSQILNTEEKRSLNDPKHGLQLKQKPFTNHDQRKFVVHRPPLRQQYMDDNGEESGLQNGLNSQKDTQFDYAFGTGVILDQDESLIFQKRDKTINDGMK